MYCGFVARPGVGKTWMMLRLAYKAWAVGKKVLFINKELPDEMMSRRWDALHLRLPYGKLKDGDLSTADEAKYKAGMAALEQSGAADRWVWLHGASTISGIAAKIEELEPDIVFVDGAYLLFDEDNAKQRWERYENISRGLKRLAQEYKVPVIISIQLNKQGDTIKNKKTQITASDVMGSDAFAQDVDLLMALEQTEDMRLNKELRMIPLKVREAEPVPIRITWDFETMESKDLGIALTVIDDDDEELDY
jgi:replicative DNA helicase